MEQGSSLSGRAMLAIVGVAVVCLTMLWDLKLTFDYLSFFEDAKAGEIDMARAEGLDEAAITGVIAMLGSFIFSAIFFLRWFRRAHSKISERLDFTPKHSEGQVKWAFFIPFINFVRPFQVMSDIYQGSDSEMQKSPLVGAWWFFWIGSGILSRVSSSMTTGNDSDLDSFILGSQLDLASDIMSILAGVLVIMLILKIDKMQRSLSLRGDVFD